MADVVNRIVPSSVALDRASWQGRERQRKGEKASRADSFPPEEPVTAQATDGVESAPKNPKTDKGKHLDVSV